MSVEINATNFPDAQFRSYVSTTFDPNNTGYLSDEIISETTTIEIVSGSQHLYQGLADLTGIEYFVNCETLLLRGLTTSTGRFTITNIDLSALTKLTSLNFEYINLNTSLDITNNTELTSFVLKNSTTTLNTIDVSHNVKLRRLYIQGFNTGDNGNPGARIGITSLDVSNLSNLLYLYLFASEVSSLNLSNSSELVAVSVMDDPNIHTLDIGNNPELITCNIACTSIDSLDISGCPKLLEQYQSGYPELLSYKGTNYYDYNSPSGGLQINASGVTIITEAASQDIPIDSEHFPDAVFRQYVSDHFDTNRDGYLDDTEISNAETLVFSSSTSGLTSLASLAGLRLLPNINHITIQGAGNLSDISELSALTEVSYLSISYCPLITTIDLSGISVALTSFYYAMRNGNPSNINISGLALCTNLQSITILNHGATGTDAPSQQASINSSNALDVSDLSDLTHMSCSGFTISEINLEGCSALESLGLSRTNIAYLDLTDYTALRTVSCANSLLSAIKVSSLSSLTQLVLNDTSITELDVSGCVALTSLDISRTGISVLDLLDQQNLQYLLVTSASSLFSIPGLGQNSNLSRLHIGETKLDASSINLNNHPSLKEFIAIRVPTLTSIDIGNATYLLRAYQNGTHTSPPDIEQYYILSDHIELIVDKSLTISTTGGSASVLPVITTQPQSVTVPLKENATISVAASGENLQYQWQSWDRDHWIDHRDSGTTGQLPSFTVGSVSDSGHTSTYRCKVSNAAGAVYSNEATVTWAQSTLPIIITQPQSAFVIEGEDVTFSIEASGSDLSYQWEVSIDDGETWADIRGAAASSFSFAASLGSNGNKVRCKVTNSSGSVYSDTATLTVEEDTRLAAPIIDTQPTSISTAEGNVATFSVTASGENLFYQWQINQNGTWYSISGATSASYSVTASLSLNNARYRCQISNAAGSVYSTEATLSVTGGQSVSTPTVTSNPRSITVEDGQLASFRVLATGGSLSYQWQVKRNNTWYAISGATNQVLSVRAASDTNGNQYRCQVSNAAGAVYSTVATLTVNESTPLTFYGYHSIIISGKNTYGEWEMYPTSRPHVAQPEVKTSYVEVPGADGGLDYTELLNGKPNYGYRKGSWEFLLIPQERWPEVYRSLCNFLHGREHTIVLEDDPKWTYRGRLSVNEWRSAAHNSLITIDYILDPIATSTDDEEYDPDADDLDAAERLLRKPGNEDKAIILWQGAATIVEKDSLFEDGDNILY